MLNQKPRLRLKIACWAVIATTLTLSGSAEAASTLPRPPSSTPPPKTYTCACACSTESGTNAAIYNRTFSSTVPCKSWSGKTCWNTMKTKEGTRNVYGRWEGCYSLANWLSLCGQNQIPPRGRDNFTTVQDNLRWKSCRWLCDTVGM